VSLTTIPRSDLICGVCGLGMHISANSGLPYHTDRNAQLGSYLRADRDHLAVADDEFSWAGRETPPPTPCRTSMVHFTLTGPDAGTYFCREFVTSMIHGSFGRRLEQDQGAHYAYLTEVTLNRPDICPDCQHVADCLLTAEAAPRDCTRCEAIGWSNG